MVAEMLLLSALISIAMLLSIGVLATKDNFYASLFMSATLIIVATIFAFFDLQPVFVFIVFIFVGAIGIVTVALAAIYRFAPERQISGLWAIPVAITALSLGIFIYLHTWRQILLTPLVYKQICFDLLSFMTAPEYILLILFLTSLITLLMLSVIKMERGGI